MSVMSAFAVAVGVSGHAVLLISAAPCCVIADCRKLRASPLNKILFQQFAVVLDAGQKKGPRGGVVSNHWINEQLHPRLPKIHGAHTPLGYHACSGASALATSCASRPVPSPRH